MKTIVLTCFLLVFQLINVNAQNLNQTFFEEKVGYTILIDQCDRSGLEGPEFGEYFRDEYKAYNIDKNATAKIKELSSEIKIKIVLGTWCHDSKLQVPRFLKILDEINFNDDNLELICVNRSKKTHGFSIDSLGVEFVPTFIIYRNDQETGRIIESPEESLEIDFLSILK